MKRLQWIIFLVGVAFFVAQVVASTLSDVYTTKKHFQNYSAMAPAVLSMFKNYTTTDRVTDAQFKTFTTVDRVTNSTFKSYTAHQNKTTSAHGGIVLNSTFAGYTAKYRAVIGTNARFNSMSIAKIDVSKNQPYFAVNVTNNYAGVPANGSGLKASVSGGVGIFGVSVDGTGVSGSSQNSSAVIGDSIGGVGVSGASTSNYGVMGTSESSYGGYFEPSIYSPKGIFNNISTRYRVVIGTAPNYGIFDSALGIRYAGTTTTWNDLRIEPTARNAASAPPFEESFGSSGVYSYSYQVPPAPSTLEYLYYALQMSHDWKEGSTVKPHVHFSTSATSGNVKFKGVCYGANYTGTFASFGNWSSTTTLTGAAWKHNIGEGSSVDMTGKTISMIMNCSIHRKYGDTAAADVHMHYIDYHYEIDSTGSDTEYSKTATP